MTIKSPCYKCPDRFYDRETKKRCHNSCEKYARYQKECERIRKENRERARINNYIFGNIPRLKRASANKMFRSRKK